MPTPFPFPFPSSFGSGFSFVPGPSGPSRGQQLGAISAGTLVGALDRLIDPETNDYVRTANGEWVETSDSRTIMLIALSVHLGKSPFDPDHGTIIHDMMRDGELVEPETLQSETVRVGAALAAEGVLSNLIVAVRDDQGNRLVGPNDQTIVRTEWRDLASGSAITQAFTLR